MFFHSFWIFGERVSEKIAIRGYNRWLLVHEDNTHGGYIKIDMV